ncbi:MAG: DUF1924 domain-containing protein [Rhodospirillum sp.]|nr:DUF1924 domain-containing protein [Rhodospirillum sp.]MCF8491555.1 DUF1924 domain-containing protein [Rhodospirillum sp.]MCF8501944.1 DUF1924 domain-containing protein [Rhodospirillum sp.]
MKRPFSGNWKVALWRLWHGGIVGSGVVAYLTADEDFFFMHQFSGYLFSGLVAARLVAAVLARGKGPLALRRPAKPDAEALSGRGPLIRLVMPWMAAIMLLGFALAGYSGIAADWFKPMEGLHESLAEAAPWLVAGHLALVLGLLWRPRKGLGALLGAGLSRLGRSASVLGRRMGVALGAVALASGLGLALPDPAAAGSAQDAVMADLLARAQAADPAVTAFDPARGEALYLSRNTVDATKPSCSSCHTPDPRNQGEHVKTGRAIDPMAVSANPDRVSDLGQLDKRFSRDCPAVLGRDCTATEQGDFAAFLLSR